MVSPPEPQDDAQDVFHTPREDSLLPSSDNQQPSVTVDIDVVHCTVNKVFDSGSQGFVDLGEFPDETEFVDLGKDSGLWLSEADEEPAASEISPGSGRCGASEIPGIQSDQFGVSDDADVEKPCNMDCELMPEDEIRREVSDDKDLCFGKKSETLAVELGAKICDERDGYLIESDTSGDEATEASGKQRGMSDKEPVLKRVAADELKSGLTTV